MRVLLPTTSIPLWLQYTHLLHPALLHAMSQISNHLKPFSLTWQWAHCTQVALKIIRLQSNRAILGCGDSGHGCADDRSKSTVIMRLQYKKTKVLFFLELFLCEFSTNTVCLLLRSLPQCLIQLSYSTNSNFPVLTSNWSSPVNNPEKCPAIFQHKRHIKLHMCHFFKHFAFFLAFESQD